QQPGGPVLATAPSMIGDFPGYFTTGTVTIQTVLSARIPPNPQLEFRGLNLPNFATVTEDLRFAQLALARGAFKIAENESPQPQDRLYVNYNYFRGVPMPFVAGSGTLTLAPGTIFSQRFGTGPFVLRETLPATLGAGTITADPATLTNVTASRFD